MSEAQALFRAGRLRDAIAAQTVAVRAAPGDLDKRWFLAELLCFAGERERADRMLDIIGSQTAAPQEVVAFRLLLRAEEIRHQVLFEGRAPQIVGPCAGSLQGVLEALLLLRSGEPGAAAARLAVHLESAPPVAGRHDGVAFTEFRDLDDVLATVVELIGGDGGYRWVAIADIVRLELQPLRRPRDLMWRPAQIAVADGPAGAVWLPCLYAADQPIADDPIALGRRTDWQEGEEGLVRGSGQRIYLLGENDVPIHELGTVEFARVANGD